ncbi:NAD-dependent protein deacylase [Halobacillus fulvus]|nr:NAD-dependent protein deacylase [Halobacillus fulvus]
MKSLYETIAFHIQKSKSVAVLTGAGVSTASGIPDFRSSEGLWTEDQSREFYMSKDYFHHHPIDFWKRFKSIFRIKLLQNYEPNTVHHFIKELETEERTVFVITQNVDGLHGRAGNEQVIEYHGSLNGATCPHCKREYGLDHILQKGTPTCSHCAVYLKPNVVLFGDAITTHDEAEQVIEQADMLFVLGTSLQVTPFNLLPFYAQTKTKVIVNNEPTDYDHLFDFVIHEDLSTAIQKLESHLG